ncbi:MAG TPA: hemolysin family protein [Ktedonobacterales bacterium]|jgi:putative hemolysin|nr:hemolysin family protein [Ktedonobacterales bacterium]
MPVLEIAILLILILANGFFSGSEIAIVSARRGRLEQQAEHGNQAAKQALDLAENPDRFLATVQVGINLIATLAGAFGAAQLSEPAASLLSRFSLIAPYARTISFAVLVLLITYFTLVLGELVPKRIGLRYAERVAIFAAPFMVWLAKLARPIIAVLTLSVNVVLRALGQSGNSETPVTEEDILHLTREGTSVGTVESDEAQLIQRVFRFSDRLVRDVMTPRTNIVAADIHMPLDEILDLFDSSGYSRLPIYNGELDNVVGILYAKDLLRARNQPNVDIQKLLHPPTFVLPHQHVNDILSTFRQKGTHLGLVVDEYGQIDGLVTLEDVLEELVGEIRDEFDVAEDVGDGTLVRRPDGSWLADGILHFDAVAERLGIPPPPPSEASQYTTLAGFMLQRLQRIPRTGDTVEVDGFRLEVVDMDGRRIDKVLIRPPSA